MLFRSAHGKSFIAAIAALARGDAARAQALACRLVDDGADGGCSPAEVAAAFQVFQQAYHARLVESVAEGAARDRAGRELMGVMLSCGNALSGALAAGLQRAQQNAAQGRQAARRLQQDRDQLTALVDDDLRSALADRKSTRLNSSHIQKSRMPSSA